MTGIHCEATLNVHQAIAKIKPNKYSDPTNSLTSVKSVFYYFTLYQMG